MNDLKDITKDIVPYPAMVMAERQDKRLCITESIGKVLVLARELGATDAWMKELIVLLYTADVQLIDAVEGQALIDKFELRGA